MSQLKNIHSHSMRRLQSINHLLSIYARDIYAHSDPMDVYLDESDNTYSVRGLIDGDNMTIDDIEEALVTMSIEDEGALFEPLPIWAESWHNAGYPDPVDWIDILTISRCSGNKLGDIMENLMHCPMDPEALPTLVSVTEYAALHALAPVTVRQKAARGNIPGAVKIGRNWAIPRHADYKDARKKP